MSDLIDLNTPDPKKSLNLELSLPLIPVPRNVESNEQASPLTTETRESLGSNPFDNVLRETTEYVRKKGDPFEVMLERALRCTDDKSTELTAKSVIFKDDFTPKSKKYLKMMNKTLDESLIGNKAGPTNGEKREETLADIVASNSQCDNVAAKEKAPLFKECIFSTSATPKPQFNLHHSLPQGDRMSAGKLQCMGRSHSITDMKIASHSSDSTALSLNKSFLESKQSRQSVFSDLLDVSSVERLNPASLLSNVSLAFANDTNHISLDSDFIKMSERGISTAGNSMEIKMIQTNLSDTTKRFALNNATDSTSALSIKEEINQSVSVKGKDVEQIVNNKLIDVDVFMPELSFNESHNKNTNSTSSSDSVFIFDNSKLELKIINEAKAFSKLFEDIEEDSEEDFASSTDNFLISSDNEWMSELTPAFEAFEVEDNLIELPVSPQKNVTDNESNNLGQSSSIDNVEENFLKEIGLQFSNCVPSESQTTVITLLSDLKELVRIEDNPEACKLIDDLKSVLGLKYKTNVELLASLNVSNKLRTSEISDEKLDSTEQSGKIESSTLAKKSQEECGTGSCDKKICDNESSLLNTSRKSEDTSQVTAVSDDNSSARTSFSTNNEDHINTRNSLKASSNIGCKKDKDNLSDEQIAVKLLVDLRKLLIGQAGVAMTSQLLKSIGRTLNIALNYCKIETASQTVNKSSNRRISSSKISESGRKSHSSSVTEVACKRSSNSKYKQLEEISKKSVSTSNSSNAKRKDNSGVKHEKRSVSSSRLISTLTDKKIPISGASNMKIAETNKNEKPLAINDVKNKLKKKSAAVSKRGPVKAVHPLGTLQKKVEEQAASSSQATTPPKSNTVVSFGSKIISSTPNSTISSIPDNQTSETSKSQLKSIGKKRNFSCDISPVVTSRNNSSNKPIESFPAKTPTRQRANSTSIPKYCTPSRKLSTSFDMDSRPQSPQTLNKSLTNYQRHSPVCRKSAEKRSQNRLKESNEFPEKPFKLISKLKGNTASNFAEKENYGVK